MLSRGQAWHVHDDVKCNRPDWPLVRHTSASHWQTGTADAMLTRMDDVTPNRNEAVEPDAERQRRLAWEARMIAEARAQLDAGFYVDAADVDAWINSLDTDNELPPPPNWV
jgi:predicted transcriptional regulator